MASRRKHRTKNRRRQTRKNRPHREITAGFILINKQYTKVLLIQNLDGSYGLPKGHAEPRDRNLLETAKRETKEEVGVRVNDAQVRNFRRKLEARFYRKQHYSRDRPSGWISKEIHLFLAVVPETVRVKVQPEEILSHEWVPIADVRSRLKINCNSSKKVRDVVSAISAAKRSLS